MLASHAYVFNDPDAAALRTARHADLLNPCLVNAGYGHRGWIVVAELGRDQYLELDALSAGHADQLARAWVSPVNGRASTASVNRVTPQGWLDCITVYVESAQ
jgi:hypothetical protein